MKTYEIQKYGGPEGLKLVDRPLPELGDHDVVVQIRAASLNYRDLVVIRGQYDRNPREGRVPLSDGAGEVVSVGSAVTRFKVGDKVAGCFFQAWPSGRFEAAMPRRALGGQIDGVLMEQVKFRQGCHSFRDLRR